jgi:hypothetical protein
MMYIISSSPMCCDIRSLNNNGQQHLLDLEVYRNDFAFTKRILIMFEQTSCLDC